MRHYWNLLKGSFSGFPISLNFPCKWWLLKPFLRGRLQKAASLSASVAVDCPDRWLLDDDYYDDDDGYYYYYYSSILGYPHFRKPLFP